MIRRKVKILYGNLLSLLLRVFGKDKKASDAIFIFSLPRSGSTWLMEIVQSFSQISGVFEPLKHDEEILMAQFSRVCIQSGNLEVLNDPNFKKYIEDVVIGKRLSRWSSNHTSLRKYFNSTKICIKFIRASFMLSWFNKHYPENNKIILLRHPGAIIESMLRSYERWNLLLDKDFLLKKSNQNFDGKYNNLIEKASTDMDMLSIYCCLEIKALLSSFDIDKNNQLMFYEDLLQNNEETKRQLVFLTKSNISNNVMEAFKKASTTTDKQDQSSGNNSSIEKWKKRLSIKDQTRLQTYLDHFEIDFYHVDTLTPKRSKLLLN